MQELLDNHLILMKWFKDNVNILERVKDAQEGLPRFTHVGSGGFFDPIHYKEQSRSGISINKTNNTVELYHRDCYGVANIIIDLEAIYQKDIEAYIQSLYEEKKKIREDRERAKKLIEYNTLKQELFGE